jgi:hypothetical protein
VTAHPQEPHDDEADCFEAVPRRSGRVRRAFASLVFGGRIREARDIALFNDHGAAVAYAIKHQKEIGAKIQEMLNYPH